MRKRYESEQLRRNLRKVKTKEFLKEVWSNKMARVGVVIIAVFAFFSYRLSYRGEDAYE